MKSWTVFFILLASSAAQAQCPTCETIRRAQTPLRLQNAVFPLNEDNQSEAGFTLTAGRPVIVPDLQPNSEPIFRSGNCANGEGTQQQMCEMFNAFRRNNGLPELFMDPRLNQIAQAYAEQMVASGNFNHVDENGVGPDQRVSQAGVRWTGVAENIAKGQKSVQEAFFGFLDPQTQQRVGGWYQSPGHRENMVSQDYNREGFGYANGYWVHLFMRD